MVIVINIMIINNAVSLMEFLPFKNEASLGLNKNKILSEVVVNMIAHSNTVSNSKVAILYCIVSFFLFFEMAIQVSPSVMSSQLMHDFNIGTLGLGIMSGLYFYSYSAMQIPSGLLFDRFNPRIIITISILFCVAGTLLLSVASNVYVGGVARLLMGCGSAFAFVSVLVVTSDLFQPKYFATMTGITQMLAAFGAMAGQMPISAMTSYMGWRHTLLSLSVVGLILAIGVWNLLKYKKRDNSSFNKSHQMNIKENLRKIISQSQTWYIALYACLLWVPMSTFASLWGVPFLVSAHHINQTLAAFLCSLMWLGLALASPLLGVLSSALNNRVLLLSLSAIVGGVAFGLVLEFNFSSLVIGLLLFFSGAACAGQALSFTVVKENNPSSVTATAIAFNNMAVVISGAIFQPLIGKLIESGQVSTSEHYNVYSFHNGLYIVLFSYVIAFLIAFFCIKEPKIAS